MLCLEGVQLLHWVRRNTENVGAGRCELGLQGGKGLRFPGTAGGIGLGVEIQDQLPAGEIGKGYLPAAVARQAEMGSRAALGWFCRHAPSFRRFPSVSVHRSGS